MFSQPLVNFKNEAKMKPSLRARGPPGVSGALRSLRILRVGRIGSDCKYYSYGYYSKNMVNFSKGFNELTHALLDV